MKRKDAKPARLTIASSRAAERRSRVRKPVNGFPPTGPTFARNPALLATTHDSGRDIPLDRPCADIKNEKEGMKYIRFPGRSGASRWRIDETEDPCDHLRRLLRGRRLLLVDVRGGPAATGWFDAAITRWIYTTYMLVAAIFLVGLGGLGLSIRRSVARPIR